MDPPRDRAESTETMVSDDSEDPLTCPLTQRLFHDPFILVASGVTYEASALEEVSSAHFSTATVTAALYLLSA